MSKKSLLKIVLPLLVLGIGVLIFGALVRLRKEPVRTERPAPGLLVRTQPVRLTDVQVEVSVFGTVAPKVQVDLIPEVAGRVVELSPSMVQGGFVAEGETLVRIDPRDYELAVARAQADVARAEFELLREEKEGEIARQEWELVNRAGMNPTGDPPTDDSLLFRGPQSKLAEANRDAAEARLREARLALERTFIRAPFSGRVRTESVDEGQYVSPGKVIATIYGTDSVEIMFPVPDADLGWFAVSEQATGKTRKGSRVLVRATYGGQMHEWTGQVIRTGGAIDPGSRLVNVMVEVPDPYNLGKSHPKARAPLTVGMFVEGRIQGTALKNVAVLPRYALREEGTVWVFRQPGVLQIRPVEVARATEDEVIVTGGLEDGDEIIISRIDAVTDGMKVREAQGTP